MAEMTRLHDGRSASASSHRAAESARSTERQSPSANMNEDDVKRFLDNNREVFRRASTEIEQRVGFFIADWGSSCGFSVERIENVRIKDARRVFAKARRK